VKILTAILVGTLALAQTGTAAPNVPEDAVEPPALEIVQTAFERMFNYPSVRSVTLRIHRGASRVTYRSFDVVYKKIDGRGRTLLRFTEPEYLRGNALLMIEEEDGRNDTWISLSRTWSTTIGGASNCGAFPTRSSRGRRPMSSKRERRPTLNTRR
jgi:hypothetical protein